MPLPRPFPENGGGNSRVIGVLGGTFDPIHNGHLEVAQLDLVWLMPNAHPPHRQEPMAGPEARMRMVELAVAGRRGLIASRLEIERGGASYTIDTLRELATRFPGQGFALLIGADAAQHIRDWHQARTLLSEATFVIFNRPGTTTEPDALAALGFDPARTRVVQLETPDVSAREIRARLAAGLPIDGLVPAAVADFIREHQLYRASAGRQLG